MVTLSSACGQFTETAEEVFIIFVTFWICYQKSLFDKVVSVLEKKKMQTDDQERKVLTNFDI